jgi:hypothetical protein
LGSTAGPSGPARSTSSSPKKKETTMVQVNHPVVYRKDREDMAVHGEVSPDHQRESARSPEAAASHGALEAVHRCEDAQ